VIEGVFVAGRNKNKGFARKRESFRGRTKSASNYVEPNSFKSEDSPWSPCHRYRIRKSKRGRLLLKGNLCLLKT